MSKRNILSSLINLWYQLYWEQDSHLLYTPFKENFCKNCVNQDPDNYVEWCETLKKKDGVIGTNESGFNYLIDKRVMIWGCGEFKPVKTCPKCKSKVVARIERPEWDDTFGGYSAFYKGGIMCLTCLWTWGVEYFDPEYSYCCDIIVGKWAE